MSVLVTGCKGIRIGGAAMVLWCWYGRLRRVCVVSRLAGSPVAPVATRGGDVIGLVPDLTDM